MPSTRELRRRIRSAKVTKQITRAQEMIAASRLRGATQAALASRQYAKELGRLIATLLRSKEEPFKHPWLGLPTDKPKLVIAIASDQGLAGSFQGNLLREAVRMHGLDSQTVFMPIGKRLIGSLRRLNVPLLADETQMPRQPLVEDAERLAQKIGGLLSANKFSGVELLSTRYRSALVQETEIIALVPFVSTDTVGESTPLLYEPSTEDVLSSLLPQFLTGILYSALLDSKAAEYAARRTAMHAATDNAEDLIGRLTLTYNRVRQAAITTEIAEIVGGAAALTN